MRSAVKRRGRILFGSVLFFSVLSFSQTVVPIDAKRLDSLRSDRRGSVLLLNVWATWCVPCKEEFPDLISLSNEMKAMKVEVAAISVDYTDEVDTKIRPFLKKLNVPFRVFVSDFTSQDEFFAAFDPRWSGAVPATFLYGTDGQQKHFLLGKHDKTELRKAVEDILD